MFSLFGIFFCCCERQLIGSLELGEEPKGFIYTALSGAVRPYAEATMDISRSLIYLWNR